MDLPTTQRWTLLVALGKSDSMAQLRATLHPVYWPPYVRAASHSPGEDGKVRVEVTVGGRDRWDVQRRVRELIADMVSKPGQVTVLDITTIKGSVSRPRGGARGRRPLVELGEVPAGPPRESKSCRRCGHRPKSTGRWSQQYGGAGR
jgi:hypothetical protein